MYYSNDQDHISVYTVTAKRDMKHFFRRRDLEKYQKKQQDPQPEIQRLPGNNRYSHMFSFQYVPQSSIAFIIALRFSNGVSRSRTWLGAATKPPFLPSIFIWLHTWA
jgi:hypothetical protein